jgi:hypothetical protein
VEQVLAGVVAAGALLLLALKVFQLVLGLASVAGRAVTVFRQVLPEALLRGPVEAGAQTVEIPMLLRVERVGAETVNLLIRLPLMVGPIWAAVLAGLRARPQLMAVRVLSLSNIRPR